MRKYLKKFQKSTMRSSVNGHEKTAPDKASYISFTGDFKIWLRNVFVVPLHFIVSSSCAQIDLKKVKV